ncbi:FecR family protein [Azotobacter vinelandii]|uniref:FecR family protein n=1 Tax=Azotobacter vinelandii TaxID=354 RepID=UPI0026667135|nr:FecR family protein [Azotobacter vinelandii]WKN22957.1 FecR family protein [Azotobacter vinelandii]
MTSPPTSAASTVQEREAWRWLVRRHTPPGHERPGRDRPGCDERAFERWLAADPRHPEAYARAEAVWICSAAPAARLAEEESAALAGYLARMDAPASRRRGPASRGPAFRGPAWTLAMAACLLLVLWTGGWWQPQRWLGDLRADYVSAPGQIRELTLTDGSHLVLDSDSALALRFDGRERRVELLRGGAVFKVAHNGQPFVVGAEGGEARVLGTEFEVRRLRRETRVTVATGRVAVRADETAELPQAVLHAGQRVAFADGRLTAPEAVDSGAALAWRQGWLAFYQTPLSEVLERLGDYYPGRILLLDDDLAARRVTGSFPSADPHAVLDSLQAVLGFRQRELLGRVIVIH